MLGSVADRITVGSFDITTCLDCRASLKRAESSPSLSFSRHWCSALIAYWASIFHLNFKAELFQFIEVAFPVYGKGKGQSSLAEKRTAVSPYVSKQSARSLRLDFKSHWRKEWSVCCLLAQNSAFGSYAWRMTFTFAICGLASACF